MKATELLQKQHREIEQHLERLETAGSEDEKAIRETLASLLVAHTVIEEEIFYPAVRQHAPDLTQEALEEHALADYELARELGTKPGDATSRAKATVLADVVVRHIRKEEAEMFRKADAAITNQELAELGDRMSVRFEEVRGKGFQRFLTAALVENMPKLVGRPQLQKGATRRGASTNAGASAKKKARGQAAKAAPAKRAAAAKPATRRAPTKRGAEGAKRGAEGARKGSKTGRTTRAGRARTRAAS